MKNFLHEILENPVQTKLNARLGQQLRVDDKILDRNGPITIIQNQEVKPIIYMNISKALRMVDSMEDQLNGVTMRYSIEDILEKWLDQGYTWEEINAKIKGKLFMMAFRRSGRNTKVAAQMVGVGRSTMQTLLQQRKTKLIETKGGQNGINTGNRDSGEDL